MVITGPGKPRYYVNSVLCPKTRNRKLGEIMEGRFSDHVFNYLKIW